MEIALHHFCYILIIIIKSHVPPHSGDGACTKAYTLIGGDQWDSPYGLSIKYFFYLVFLSSPSEILITCILVSIASQR